MIIQTNTFVCDKCGKIVSVSTDVGCYDDPVINMPDGWTCPGDENSDPNLDLCEVCKNA